MSKTGPIFLDKLKEVSGISNVRGRGFMIAFDLKDKEERNLVLNHLSEDMLALKCGQKSIRLRPHLDFNEIDLAVSFIQKAVHKVI